MLHLTQDECILCTPTICAAAGLSWFSNPIRKKTTYFPVAAAATTTSHDQFSIISLKRLGPVIR